MDNNIYQNVCDGDKQLKKNQLKPVLSYIKWIPSSQLKSRYVKVHQIVPGPFSSPRLVTISSPTTSREHIETNTHSKTGIPDPWPEYLKQNNLCDKSDLYRKNYKIKFAGPEYCRHYQIINHSWNKWGLSFEQGIPDPWKNFNIKYVVEKTEDMDE